MGRHILPGYAAILLAGGSARRMGGAAKPLRQVGGVPMIKRVLAATADASRIVVVGPAYLVAHLPAGTTLVQEDPPGSGPVAAIAAGLQALSGLGPPVAVAAVVGADLPLLSSDAIARLRHALQGDTDGATDAPAGTVDAAFAVDDADRPQWLCGVWRVSALRDKLGSLGQPGGRGVRQLAGGLRVRTCRLPDDPRSRLPAWLDCDTEDDIALIDAAVTADPAASPRQTASPH